MNKNIIKLAIAGIMISGSCTMLHASDYYSSVSDEPISQSSLREKLTLIEDHIARLEGSEGLHEAEQILDDAKSKLRELENRLGGIKVFFDHTKKIGDEWTDVLGFKHKKSYKESEECTNFYGTVHIIWPGQWVEGDGNLHWKTSDGLTQWTDDNYTLHWIGSDGHEYEVPNGEYNFTTKAGKLASIADGSWYELIDQDGNHVGWDELSYEKYRVK